MKIKSIFDCSELINEIINLHKKFPPKNNETAIEYIKRASFLDGQIQERERLAKEVKEIIDKCGQVSGRAIRENVVSNGNEYYIDLKKLEQNLF